MRDLLDLAGHALMPELCHIYKPVLRTCSHAEYAAFRCHTIWDLTRRKILYKVEDGMWAVKLDDVTLLSENLRALKDAVTLLAQRDGGFTDYAEAKAFIVRKNAKPR